MAGPTSIDNLEIDKISPLKAAQAEPTSLRPASPKGRKGLMARIAPLVRGVAASGLSSEEIEIEVDRETASPAMLEEKHDFLSAAESVIVAADNSARIMIDLLRPYQLNVDELIVSSMSMVSDVGVEGVADAPLEGEAEEIKLQSSAEVISSIIAELSELKKQSGQKLTEARQTEVVAQLFKARSDLEDALIKTRQERLSAVTDNIAKIDAAIRSQDDHQIDMIPQLQVALNDDLAYLKSLPSVAELRVDNQRMASLIEDRNSMLELATDWNGRGDDRTGAVAEAFNKAARKLVRPIIDALVCDIDGLKEFDSGQEINIAEARSRAVSDAESVFDEVAQRSARKIIKKVTEHKRGEELILLSADFEEKEAEVKRIEGLKLEQEQIVTQNKPQHDSFKELRSESSAVMTEIDDKKSRLEGLTSDLQDVGVLATERGKLQSDALNLSKKRNSFIRKIFPFAFRGSNKVLDDNIAATRLQIVVNNEAINDKVNPQRSGESLSVDLYKNRVETQIYSLNSDIMSATERLERLKVRQAQSAAGERDYNVAREAVMSISDDLRIKIEERSRVRREIDKLTVLRNEEARAEEIGMLEGGVVDIVERGVFSALQEEERVVATTLSKVQEYSDHIAASPELTELAQRKQDVAQKAEWLAGAVSRRMQEYCELVDKVQKGILDAKTIKNRAKTAMQALASLSGSISVPFVSAGLKAIFTLGSKALEAKQKAAFMQISLLRDSFASGSEASFETFMDKFSAQLVAVYSESKDSVLGKLNQAALSDFCSALVTDALGHVPDLVRENPQMRDQLRDHALDDAFIDQLVNLVVNRQQSSQFARVMQNLTGDRRTAAINAKGQTITGLGAIEGCGIEFADGTRLIPTNRNDDAKYGFAKATPQQELDRVRPEKFTGYIVFVQFAERFEKSFDKMASEFFGRDFLANLQSRLSLDPELELRLASDPTLDAEFNNYKKLMEIIIEFSDRVSPGVSFESVREELKFRLAQVTYSDNPMLDVARSREVLSRCEEAIRDNKLLRGDVKKNKRLDIDACGKAFKSVLTVVAGNSFIRDAITQGDETAEAVMSATVTVSGDRRKLVAADVGRIFVGSKIELNEADIRDQRATLDHLRLFLTRQVRNLEEGRSSIVKKNADGSIPAVEDLIIEIAGISQEYSDAIISNSKAQVAKVKDELGKTFNFGNSVMGADSVRKDFNKLRAIVAQLAAHHVDNMAKPSSDYQVVNNSAKKYSEALQNLAGLLNVALSGGSAAVFIPSAQEQKLNGLLKAYTDLIYKSGRKHNDKIAQSFLAQEIPQLLTGTAVLNDDIKAAFRNASDALARVQGIAVNSSDVTVMGALVRTGLRVATRAADLNFVGEIVAVARDRVNGSDSEESGRIVEFKRDFAQISDVLQEVGEDRKRQFLDMMETTSKPDQQLLTDKAKSLLIREVARQHQASQAAVIEELKEFLRNDLALSMNNRASLVRDEAEIEATAFGIIEACQYNAEIITANPLSTLFKLRELGLLGSELHLTSIGKDRVKILESISRNLGALHIEKLTLRYDNADYLMVDGSSEKFGMALDELGRKLVTITDVGATGSVLEESKRTQLEAIIKKYAQRSKDDAKGSMATLRSEIMEMMGVIIPPVKFFGLNAEIAQAERACDKQERISVDSELQALVSKESKLNIAKRLIKSGSAIIDTFFIAIGREGNPAAEKIKDVAATLPILRESTSAMELVGIRGVRAEAASVIIEAASASQDLAKRLDLLKINFLKCAALHPGDDISKSFDRLLDIISQSSLKKVGEQEDYVKNSLKDLILAGTATRFLGRETRSPERLLLDVVKRDIIDIAGLAAGDNGEKFRNKLEAASKIADEAIVDPEARGARDEVVRLQAERLAASVAAKQAQDVKEVPQIVVLKQMLKPGIADEAVAALIHQAVSIRNTAKNPADGRSKLRSHEDLRNNASSLLNVGVSIDAILEKVITIAEERFSDAMRLPEMPVRRPESSVSDASSTITAPVLDNLPIPHRLPPIEITETIASQVPVIDISLDASSPSSVRLEDALLASSAIITPIAVTLPSSPRLEPTPISSPYTVAESAIREDLALKLDLLKINFLKCEPLHAGDNLSKSFESLLAIISTVSKNPGKSKIKLGEGVEVEKQDYVKNCLKGIILAGTAGAISRSEDRRALDLVKDDILKIAGLTTDSRFEAELRCAAEAAVDRIADPAIRQKRVEANNLQNVKSTTKEASKEAQDVKEAPKVAEIKQLLRPEANIEGLIRSALAIINDAKTVDKGISAIQSNADFQNLMNRSAKAGQSNSVTDKVIAIATERFSDAKTRAEESRNPTTSVHPTGAFQVSSLQRGGRV